MNEEEYKRWMDHHAMHEGLLTIINSNGRTLWWVLFISTVALIASTSAIAMKCNCHDMKNPHTHETNERNTSDDKNATTEMPIATVARQFAPSAALTCINRSSSLRNISVSLRSNSCPSLVKPIGADDL